MVQKKVKFSQNFEKLKKYIFKHLQQKHEVLQDPPTVSRRKQPSKWGLQHQQHFYHFRRRLRPFGHTETQDSPLTRAYCRTQWGRPTTLWSHINLKRVRQIWWTLNVMTINTNNVINGYKRAVSSVEKLYACDVYAKMFFKCIWTITIIA